LGRNSDKQLRTNKERAKHTHLYHQSKISEQFRTLRTNISFLGGGDDLSTVMMVTSPGTGEGRTTTVVNLSIVLAQQGKKVLLIDADLRKPTIHNLFDQSKNIGLSNVLSYMNKLDEAICHSGYYHLDLLPSGQVPPNPTELLSSEKMKEIVEIVGRDYDAVLFDTPPLLNYADSLLLADLCKGVILVIKSGQTSKESAAKAKELLANTNARLLGATLNGGHSKVKA
jgi:protein-tyrosine kinase